MGYYNPIYMYGTDAFITAALEAGVDGLIIVDLPLKKMANYVMVPVLQVWISFVLSPRRLWATVCLCVGKSRWVCVLRCDRRHYRHQERGNRYN